MRRTAATAFGTLLLSACAVCAVPALSATQDPPRPRREVKWNDPPATPIPGVEHKVLKSTSMARDMGYNVFLPPGYAENKEKRYPVVYFLHGATGTETSDAGGFSGLLAREIEAKRISPVICVFPNGGMSGYADRPEQKVMMETFLIRELIPQIDRDYRTTARREERSVCGFSMGGGGAIRLALKYPDLFCAAGSWAAALGNRGGESASDLAQKNEKKVRGRVGLRLIVGDKDQTYSGHAPFLKTLQDLKIPYTYRELPGVDHSLGTYYEKTGTEFARFVAGFEKK